jgi:hypothetical protein
MTLVFLDMAAPFARSGAGVRIDLDVAELGGEARRHRARVHRRRSDDRPAGLRSLGGNLNSWHTTWSDLDRAWSS